MTRTEALALARPPKKCYILTATGTDGTSWYQSHRIESDHEWTNRLEWRESAICPRGGFWHSVSVELEPAEVDWVPGWHQPTNPLQTELAKER